MSTATNAQTPRKRLRISDDVEVINNVHTNKKSEYNLYKGPLASLQPVIRPLADTYFIKLTDLFNKHVDNKAKLAKFDDTSFIPKSCRVNFTAGASNLVKGSTDYSELLAQIDNKNKETASHHRDTVKQVIKLEIKASLTTLRDTFCECIYKLATMFMHFHFFQKEIPVGQIHKLAKDIVSNEPRTIHFIFDDEVDTFSTWYNKKFNIVLAAYTNYATAATATAANPPPDDDPIDTIILSLLPNGSRDINDYNLSELEEGQYAYAEYDNPGSGLESILAHRRLRHSQATTASLNNQPFSQATTASLNDQPFSRTQSSTAATASLNDLPFSRSQSTQASTATSTTLPTGNTQPTQGTPHHILPALQRDQLSLLILHMTFHSWSAKIHLHEEKLKNAELTKLATTLLTADVTNDVAMTIAAQPPASEAIINDLINSKFEELKKALLKDNASNKRKDSTKPPPKNAKRGKIVTRASASKKSKTVPTKQLPAKSPNSTLKRPPTAKKAEKSDKSSNSKNHQVGIHPAANHPQIEAVKSTLQQTQAAPTTRKANRKTLLRHHDATLALDAVRKLRETTPQPSVSIH
jgi:hypothetical protein